MGPHHGQTIREPSQLPYIFREYIFNVRPIFYLLSLSRYFLPFSISFSYFFSFLPIHFLYTRVLASTLFRVCLVLSRLVCLYRIFLFLSCVLLSPLKTIKGFRHLRFYIYINISRHRLLVPRKVANFLYLLVGFPPFLYTRNETKTKSNVFISTGRQLLLLFLQ